MSAQGGVLRPGWARGAPGGACQATFHRRSAYSPAPDWVRPAPWPVARAGGQGRGRAPPTHTVLEAPTVHLGRTSALYPARGPYRGRPPQSGGLSDPPPRAKAGFSGVLKAWHPVGSHSSPLLPSTGSCCLARGCPSLRGRNPNTAPPGLRQMGPPGAVVVGTSIPSHPACSREEGRWHHALPFTSLPGSGPGAPSFPS